MIPLGLFRSASFSAAVATQFLLAAAIYSAAFLTSQFFQFALGDSPLGTGLRFLPWTATPMVIAPIAGAVFDKIGARPLIVPGLLMQAAGFGWIVYLAVRSSGYASYVAPLLIAGVGITEGLLCGADGFWSGCPGPGGAADAEGGDGSENRQARGDSQGRAVAAGDGGRGGQAAVGVEHGRGDRDPEHGAELLHRVHHARGLAERFRADRVQARGGNARKGAARSSHGPGAPAI